MTSGIHINFPMMLTAVDGTFRCRQLSSAGNHATPYYYSVAGLVQVGQQLGILVQISCISVTESKCVSGGQGDSLGLRLQYPWYPRKLTSFWLEHPLQETTSRQKMYSLTPAPPRLCQPGAQWLTASYTNHTQRQIYSIYWFGLSSLSKLSADSTPDEYAIFIC